MGAVAARAALGPPEDSCASVYRPRNPRESLFTNSSRPTTSTSRLLSRGATEEGLETLRQAHSSNASLLTQASLARALVRAGRRGEALQAYRELVNSQPKPWEGHVEWALAHLTLGRLYEEAGETAKARATYLRLLGIWKDANPDLPPLLEVRGALGRLPVAVP